MAYLDLRDSPRLRGTNAATVKARLDEPGRRFVQELEGTAGKEGKSEEPRPLRAFG